LSSGAAVGSLILGATVGSALGAGAAGGSLGVGAGAWTTWSCFDSPPPIRRLK
jgi:hypothetical protein